MCPRSRLSARPTGSDWPCWQWPGPRTGQEPTALQALLEGVRAVLGKQQARRQQEVADWRYGLGIMAATLIANSPAAAHPAGLASGLLGPGCCCGCELGQGGRQAHRGLVCPAQPVN